MKSVFAATLGLAFVLGAGVRAEEAQPHKLGDHPAVVVQRLNKSAGYDYASKFYPHPAWMYLSATPHEEESDSVGSFEPNTPQDATVRMARETRSQQHANRGRPIR